MPTILKRMHKLKTLLNIRIGPGAAILPPDVIQLSIQFADKGIKHGHIGLKKFRQNMLPRLKYRNPQIPMLVSKALPETESPILQVVFRRTDSSDSQISPALPADATTDSTAPLTASDASEERDSNADTLMPFGDTPNRKRFRVPENSRTVEINCKNKEPPQIWEEFLIVAKAEPVPPSETELVEQQKLQEEEKEANRLRMKTAKLKAARKREEDMLRMARGEVAKEGMAG